MNKTAQCMVKAAQLRAHADKLEKVALLLDGSDEVTGADLGIGAGALGLLGGGAYGVNKLMQNRAAAKAAAEAAAAKAAQKSQLLKGVLGLGGLGTLGVAGYDLHRLARSLDPAVKIKNLVDAAGALDGMARGKHYPSSDNAAYLKSLADAVGAMSATVGK